MGRHDQSLGARLMRLRATVAHHKAEIRKHREELALAKTALVELEAECRRMGIELIVVSAADTTPTTGVGAIHGHHGTDRPDPRSHH